MASNGTDRIVEVWSFAAAEQSAVAKDDWQQMTFVGAVECSRKSHHLRQRAAACDQSGMLIDRWLRHNAWEWWSSVSFDVGLRNYLPVLTAERFIVSLYKHLTVTHKWNCTVSMRKETAQWNGWSSPDNMWLSIIIRKYQQGHCSSELSTIGHKSRN